MLEVSPFCFGALFVRRCLHVVYRNLMEAEREKAVSLVECFYWVLTTMSTLGYGDITFKGDAGRLFSMMVMFTGVLPLYRASLCLREFLYKPFMEYQTGARVARKFEHPEGNPSF